MDTSNITNESKLQELEKKDNTNLLNYLSATIKETRMKLNLSQKEFSRKLKISTSTLNIIENGTKYPSFSTVQKFIDIFNLKVVFVDKDVDLKNVNSVTKTLEEEKEKNKQIIKYLSLIIQNWS